ncbi:hypothetical protein COZ22_01800 [bacterium (Candidatus Howlettbacteria) CG_4_10_14_3_um_filter_37_10]|nr:MAG: hypothetical protein COX25_03125 [bacterium (Candidatus Howlettbacteria) CG23_combo_of_CG06-09_8_20_14_all_37_9]PIX99759.1 MAG: hypothetical protein COZ22_01800 [bacterium (Candidatus Howlettbacteria) CG_4_10_14_3_um_filter_37_10]PJB06674.1 MAG: hypothetical protein CO123_01630 [bacterium (Candidatus Howlettbacteria) CG_4_9_14_3_um_filter_37_10]
MKKELILALLMASLSGAGFLFAHSGRTDSSGCHNDYIHGGYHCHNNYYVPEYTRPTVAPVFTPTTMPTPIITPTPKPTQATTPITKNSSSESDWGFLWIILGIWAMFGFISWLWEKLKKFWNGDF